MESLPGRRFGALFPHLAHFFVHELHFLLTNPQKVSDELGLILPTSNRAGRTATHAVPVVSTGLYGNAHLLTGPPPQYH